MEQQDPKFDEALSALDRGDIEGLRGLLSEHPDLINAVSYSEEGCYSGYFYRPTLLHHVAGNPTRGLIPENITEITKLLLDMGADVDAYCGGGPSQPTTGGGTVLGLVASGGATQEAGHSYALLDLLLEHGATMDFVGDGGLMWISIYHTVENRDQILVAKHLAKRGHELDMCFAAGLGDVEKIMTHIKSDGNLKSGADRLYRKHCSRPSVTDQDIWQDVLLFACICNHENIARLALKHKAQINGLRPWGPAELVTPLHGAAWAGQTEMAGFLLEEGADTKIKDPEHEATPLEWARHCQRRETAEVIENFMG